MIRATHLVVWTLTRLGRLTAIGVALACSGCAPDPESVVGGPVAQSDLEARGAGLAVGEQFYVLDGCFSGYWVTATANVTNANGAFEPGDTCMTPDDSRITVLARLGDGGSRIRVDQLANRAGGTECPAGQYLMDAATSQRVRRLRQSAGALRAGTRFRVGQQFGAAGVGLVVSNNELARTWVVATSRRRANSHYENFVEAGEACLLAAGSRAALLGWMQDGRALIQLDEAETTQGSACPNGRYLVGR